jgi:hypothetical protein
VPVSIGDNRPGGGTLYRIDLATGHIEQTFSFVTPPNQGPKQGESGVGRTPAVIGGKIYKGSRATVVVLSARSTCVGRSLFHAWMVSERLFLEKMLPHLVVWRIKSIRRHGFGLFEQV